MNFTWFSEVIEDGGGRGGGGGGDGEGGGGGGGRFFDIEWDEINQARCATKLHLFLLA